MSDDEMTDFEGRFARRLERYLAVPVRPFDANAIAATVAAGGRRRSFGWLRFGGRPVFSPSLAIVVVGLLLALIAAIVVGAVVLRTQLNEPPGRNGLIAYEVWDMTHRPYTHIHVMNPDGTGDHEIAQGAGPIFAEDGNSLAYSIGYGLGASYQRLHVADGDGSNPRDIAAYGEGGFAFAPDGSVIAVKTDGPAPEYPAGEATWLVSVEDGTGRELVPRPENSTLRYWDMTWSPDSKSIAYSVIRDVTNGDNSGYVRDAIDIVDVASGNVRRLTSRSGTSETAISWAPDSGAIAYLGLPDGSPLPSLGTGLDASDSFSPQEDVFVINADGSGEVNVTDNDTPDIWPRWAPDGSALAYATFADTGDESAGYRLEVRNISGLRPVGRSTVGPLVEEFQWSPDAKTFAYVNTAQSAARSHSTISTIDAAFLHEPTVLASVEFRADALSWQWLAP